MWNGDVSLNTTIWKEVIAAETIDFFNSPAINATGLNGHGTVTFNGTDQYGQNTTAPIYTQPLTIYFVVNQITWSGATILDCGNVPSAGNLMALQQNGASPSLRIRNQSNIILSPDLPVNTWGIITMVFNGANSEIRLNLNSAVTGSIGSGDSSGITLADFNGLGVNANISTAYIIYRDVADNTSKQNQYINFLKNRFAI